jgi:hypothetical protein
VDFAARMVYYCPAAFNKGAARDVEENRAEQQQQQEEQSYEETNAG